MTPPGQSNTLPRARCPVCGKEVALRRDQQLREHRDARDPKFGTGTWSPLCPASGNDINDAMCRECGCTDYNACDDGCWWVEADLCSSCAP